MTQAIVKSDIINSVATKDRSIFLDVAKFEHAQRVCKMLASSTMVPEHFRNNLGNCIIALNYADRVGIDPFMAMQKMYVIHGKPAVETQLQIALFNSCGRFSTLKYKMSGIGDDLTCIAYATDLKTKEILEGPPVSIKTAKSEGWYNKNGSKWKTIPDLMLRYRSAAFFIRTYAPETTLGLYTSEEVYDSNDVIDVDNFQDEIETEANSKLIDIKKEDTNQIQENTGPTEQEMTEIQAEEMAQSEAEKNDGGPDF